MDSNHLVSCLLPPLVSTSKTHDQEPPKAHGSVTIHDREACRRLQNQLSDAGGVGAVQVMKAAWALVLRSYTSQEQVCFRIANETAIGSSTDVGGMCYAHIAASTTGRLLLRHVMEFHESAACGSSGENQNNHHRLVNTAVYEDRSDDRLEGIDLLHNVRICYDTENVVESTVIKYKCNALSGEQAKTIAGTLRHTISEIIHNLDTPVRELTLCSQADTDQMIDWNASLGTDSSWNPECVHDIILRRGRDSLDQAVSAWDGELTYSELAEQSTHLAAQLVAMGIGPETFIPLCFEKSKMVVVALLGVIQAGAAFVLLDPSHPIDRLKRICKSVAAPLVVSSLSCAALSHQLAEQTLCLDRESPPTSELPPLSVPRCTPRNSLYAVFTSGSTGEPKGLVMEHGAFCTSTKRSARALRLGPDMRRLQFSSHSFTMCNRELLTTLLVGGCICIPSESERIGDLAGFINRHRVNYAHLTPALAELLSPDSVPTLRVLSVGGDRIGKSQLKNWVNRVELIYGYGASETAGPAAVVSVLSSDWDPHTIGHSHDSALWVVDPDNSDRLVPIGAVGELLIQGPGLARHYLNDELRTKRQFLGCVEWQPQPSQSRLYRTGDLVRYNMDGSIYYIGRRDSQIKVNGQLIVLADIEEHIKSCPDPRVKDVIVVPLFSGAGDDVQKHRKLAAFVGKASPQGIGETEVEILPDSVSSPWADKLEAYLTTVLPRFMIPAHFVFMNRLPLTKSGKVDRVQLMKTPLSPPKDFDQASPEPCTTSEEKALQAIWAETLNTQPPGRHDDFFRIGGDSLQAIITVSMLKEVGLTLTVGDIFKHRTLAAIASAITKEASDHICAPPLPFSLLPTDVNLQKAVASELAIDPNIIEDIYSCTPMQEGLMALSTKRPGAYIAQLRWRLSDSIDMARFRNSWITVWDSNPILRTRIARLDQSMFQVVVRHEIPWEVLEDEGQLPLVNVDHGPIVRFAITSGPQSFFRIAIHHSIFDAWSLNLLLEQVEQAYRGNHITSHPFSLFVQHVHARAPSSSEQFWRAEFAGFSGCYFPENHEPVATPSEGVSTVTHSVDVKTWPGAQSTRASALRLAWAVVISKEVGSKDVVFGTVVTGRSASMQGIDRVCGPVLATVPVRIKLNSSDSVQKALCGVQEQLTRMIDHEQTGLQNIRQAGSEAAAACSLQNLLIIQDRQRTSAMRSGLFRDLITTEVDYLLPFASYPLQLTCELEKDRLIMKAAFSSQVISEADTRRILHQLGHVYVQLLLDQHQTIGGVNVVPPGDLEKLQKWNSNVPIASHASIHSLIGARCRAQPSSLAVYGHDVQLTYGDLSMHADRLASSLILKGVQRGDIVPLLFEKSPWATVAMLGVLQAGAAFLMLPSSYPVQRLKRLVSAVDAQIIVSSAACAEVSHDMHANVSIFPSSHAEGLSNAPPMPHVEQSSPAFVLFTSGSTGEPKGIVTSHGAISTAAENICCSLRLTPRSRVLQLSSYAFDVSINETLLSLAVGACICVPTEHERENDPSKAARDMQANWVFTTPSMMRLLNPTEAPTLRTIVLAGEPLPRDLICAWESHVEIIQAYGPAECTLVPTVRLDIRSDSDPRNIGPSTGTATWIVDPNNHDLLLPIGVTGELLLEGPTMALGYLKNPEQTAAAFIKSPCWLTHLRAPSQPGPVYKTGDLVRYAPDGSIIFLGRKDLQVKFHGIRIEPGELEHQITTLSKSVSEAIIEVIRPQSQTNRDRLVAFVRPCSEIDWGSSNLQQCSFIESPSSRFFDDVTALHSHLSRSLPRHMLPSLCVPLVMMPHTPSGKVNRRLLREEVSSWTQDRVLTYSSERQHAGSFISPTTNCGRILRRLVANVLGLEPGSVNMASDFFDIGGDSITATLLSASARREGLVATVQDILKHRILSEIPIKTNLPLEQAHHHRVRRHPAHEMAVIRAERLRDLVADVLNIKSSEVNVESDFFALGGSASTGRQLLVLASEQGIHLTDEIIRDHPIVSYIATMASEEAANGVGQGLGAYWSPHLGRLSEQLSGDDLKNIDEILPITEFQRFSFQFMRYRYFRIQLNQGFDRGRLLRACQSLVNHHSILRTGFAIDNGGGLQFTFRSWDVQFHKYSVDDLEEHCRKDCTVAEPPYCGKPPLQIQLVTLPNAHVFLVFRLAHALWDIHSLNIIAKDLSDLYNGGLLPPTTPFSEYVRAARDLRSEAAYSTWRSILDGSHVTHLTGKSLPVPIDISPQETEYLVDARKVIPMISVPHHVTLSTLLKTAWAVTLRYLFPSQPHDSTEKSCLQDVVFGQVVLARSHGLPHEDRIVGPCLSTIPVRVHFDPVTSKLALLQQVQEQLINTMPFATLGFDDIVRNCTPWPSSTTLPSYVRIQNYDSQTTCSLDGFQCDCSHSGLPNKPTRSANIHIRPTTTELHVGITVSSHVLGPKQSQYVVECFCKVIQAFDSACIQELPDVGPPC
ncbi:hypothetical protein N7536_008671 [Penicillium majusculum]|nr:hypothetical protein N7536_008671 [Penicillium majusculum]